MKREIVIIGGGASGLFLSSLLPSSLLLEKNHMVGKKLLLTGGGKCNLTHQGMEKEIVEHYYDKKRFVSPAIYTLGPEKIRAYFSSLSLETFTREDGKVFPVTQQSQSVIDALCINEIKLNERVVSLKREDEEFIIQTDKNEIRAEKVVVATGGSSYPSTGSDGNFFPILSYLGHKIIPPRPALCQLKTKEDVRALEGLTIPSTSIKVGKHKYSGPLLFTNNGISGPMVLNLSRELEGETEVEVSLSSITENEILSSKKNQKGIKAVHEMTGLPLRFLSSRLSWGDKNIGDLSKKDLLEYRNKIASWKTFVTNKGMLGSSMVTRGGVDTQEVDKITFKSKIVPNLWIIGEALDVDGECGGYNLSFAFASAYSAYLSLIKE